MNSPSITKKNQFVAYNLHFEVYFVNIRLINNRLPTPSYTTCSAFYSESQLINPRSRRRFTPFF